MMKAKELSLYLKGKIPPNTIRNCIYRSLNAEIQKEARAENFMQEFIADQGYRRKVTAIQFLNLLNDYINGRINRYELFYILMAIEKSRDLIVENPGAIEILYQVATNVNHPIGISYIKSMIYRP